MNAEETRAPLPTSAWYIDLLDEAATVSLASLIAGIVQPGDLLTLSGDLGSGKTTFARALIRALTREPELEVPSPTYTLIQVYESTAPGALKFPIVHADLFRIKEASELAELGWDEAAEGALVLVEWPERAGDSLTGDRLDIAFRIDAEKGGEFRTAALTGTGAFAPRLAYQKGVQDILEQSGFQNAARTFMLGDASTRTYERLTKPDGSTALLMFFPPRPDGPPVRFGKSYSEIAHLAENIRPFIAMDHALLGLGLSAPRILAHDVSTGFAVIEDLGSEPLTDDNGPIFARYAEAAGVLAKLHASERPRAIPGATGDTYTIPLYDSEALTIEVELLLDWYVPHIAQATPASGVRSDFSDLWRDLFTDITATAPTWTLRDYHSPNLIWLEDRDGTARVGLIDFQDCVMGHPAYDVASLLQDARVTVPADLELKLLGLYAKLRRSLDPSFDMVEFARAYAVLGAQRATKILGIFARLDKRDRKPQYLVHLPRIQTYLKKNLAHPVLAELKTWYETNLPGVLAPPP
ncbi:MAG: tRNA (adenosine(37)-N6)-threonylcarbamoyltransferase complex ATPase subunit type 1 TsaE [Beijerinckiaceae bacterium]|nr:tRNA (adenosine(37)-N6)-threonylcarbamoyltransferase complex ATPase subunit type 1 TsaE [Beijerinckiaceae bacterium]